MPKTNQRAVQVGDRLGYLLKHAHTELGAAHAELLAPFDIDAGELGLLILIAERPPESQQQVARRLGIDRTTMVDTIDVLEAKGLVSRHPDVTDRRRKVVMLTPDGEAMLPRAIAASDEAERRLLAELDPDERGLLRELLRRVVAAPGEPSGRSGG